MSTRIDQPGDADEPPQGDSHNRPTSVAAMTSTSRTKPSRRVVQGVVIAGSIIYGLAVISTIIAITSVTLVATNPSEQDSEQQLDELPDGATELLGDATGDVAIFTCSVGQYGVLYASARVTNSTDAVASYRVTAVAIDANGNHVAEMMGAADSVAPGQWVPVSLIGGLDEAPEGMQCVVADVTRYAG